MDNVEPFSIFQKCPDFLFLSKILTNSSRPIETFFPNISLNTFQKLFLHNREKIFLHNVENPIFFSLPFMCFVDVLRWSKNLILNISGFPGHYFKNWYEECCTAFFKHIVRRMLYSILLTYCQKNAIQHSSNIVYSVCTVYM